MYHYEATFTYHYDTATNPPLEATATATVNIYAHDFNTAMLLAASKFMSMYNSSDYRISKIELSLLN